MTLPTDFTNALPAMATAAAANGGTDYKALVFLFLNGGNDTHNTVLPVGAQHTQYRIDRTEALSIASGSVLSLNSTPTAGLHPSLTGIQTIYNAGKCAIVCNVGPLIEPMNKAEYGQHFAPGTGRRPYQLQSHSDQQNTWQTSRPDYAGEGTGWGGRLNELYEGDFNPSRTMPSALTIAGRTRFLVGYDMNQYRVGDGPSLAQEFLNDSSLQGGTTNPASNSQMKRVINNWAAYGRTNKIESELRAIMQRSVTYSTAVAAAGGSSTVNVTFPSSGLGNQLRNVARLIRGRASAGHRRQVFFVQLGGFDLHGDTNAAGTMTQHAGLLTTVDQAVKAFYDEMVAQGMSNNVTLFTGSDFGRALLPNGTGTDHGWGGHHFVIGGAVQGGRLYNRDAKSGPILNTFPTITLGGTWDSGEGRLIPSISIDEYYATMAKWFGVPDASSNGVNPMNLIFPLLNNFATRDIGFMG